MSRNLESIGKSAYESIAEMVAALNCDYDRLTELRDIRDSTTDQAELDEIAEELAELEAEAGECNNQDEARERILEDALAVQVRSGWHNPGEDMEPAEFHILLATGGPAVRIMGELDFHNEPARACLEVQDWGTPWTRYFDADQDVLLDYARCFYFGE